SFGRVAKRLGISDRTVVYYFPTKSDLVGEVLVAMGVTLQGALGEAFTEPADDHRTLLRRAWPVVSDSSNERIFALFFEATGQAAAGHEPYAEIVPAIVEAWIDWTTGFITGSDDHRRREAERTVVLVDGLTLMQQVGPAGAADRVAAELGIA
ncbi:MAG: TetR/AcrR family transcriptional regulator, partial [Actinomycetota bacterium]